jgi:hypothetical protein
MADPKLTTPGPWETAIFQAGNGALLGYLPEVVEYLGGKEGDAERLRQGMALGDAANPRASTLGFAGGLALPGGVAAKTMKYAKPAVTAALGLASNAGKSAVAKGLGKTALSLLGASGLGGLGYGLFGGQSAPPPAAEQTAEAAAPAAPQRKEPDWYDNMAAIAGVDRGTIKEMVRQDGGVRLGTLQTLNGMKSRAPSYRDIAMSYVMDSFEGQAAQARGNPEAEAEVYSRMQRTLSDILGADPIPLPVNE